MNFSRLKNILSSIGNTPLTKLNNDLYKINKNINIYVKLESLNPTGSIKDRMVSCVMKDIYNNPEKLSNKSTIIEASSGNTGASVSMIANILGLKSIIATNNNCSIEQQNIMKSFGTELIITKSNIDPENSNHYQNIIKEIYSQNPEKYIWIDQYNNIRNSDAFYCSLGPELYNELNKNNKNIDYFITSSATGGTIAGVGRYLKEKSLNTQIYLCDPIGSILADYLVNGGILDENIKYKKHKIEGTGKDSIPKVFEYNKTIIDDVVQVKDYDAIKMCHFLTKYENIFIGGSGGLNVCGAIKLAKCLQKQSKYKDKDINIVTIAPDSGFKYLSKYYNPSWCQENNIF